MLPEHEHSTKVWACMNSGEAVSHKILPIEMVQQLFLVVALSMALTPFLAEFGQRLGKRYENSDMKVCSACMSAFYLMAVAGLTVASMHHEHVAWCACPETPGKRVELYCIEW